MRKRLLIKRVRAVDLLVCITALFEASSAGMPPDDEGSRTQPPGRVRVVQMIDELANHNPSPSLVRDFGDARPLFPVGYDWKEQARVRMVFAAVARVQSTEAWEEILSHSGDERYCLTMTKDGEFNHAINYSIGDICSIIALKHLTGVAKIELAKLRRGSAGNIPLGKPVSEWRRSRSGKKLYELQIEVCEMALQIAQDASDVAKDKRERVCDAIKMQIRTLSETKEAVFERFPMRAYDFYDADRAAEIRKSIANEEGK